MGKIKLYKWDIAEFLEDEEAIAAFLRDFLSDNDEAITRHALDAARRARILHGLTAVDPEVDIARATGKGNSG